MATAMVEMREGPVDNGVCLTGRRLRVLALGKATPIVLFEQSLP